MIAEERTTVICSSNWASAVLIVVGASACGVRELPPVAAPLQQQPIVQDAPTTAPLPTNSRVIFDANGETAKVLEVTGEMRGFAYAGRRSAAINAIMTKTICGETPCIADMPKGDHEIVFVRQRDDRQEIADVKLGDPDKVVRHAFGSLDVSPAFVVGVAGTTLGALSMAFSWLPFVFAGGGRSQDSHDTLISVGDGMLIGGAIAFVGGIVLSALTRPEHHPGATTEWDLPTNNPSPIPPPQGGVSF